MSHQKGANVVLKLGYESTYGGGATDGYTLPFNSSDISCKRNLVTPGTMSGTRNPVVALQGNITGGGNIVVPADSACLPYWMILAFGAPTVSGASPYVHEWKIPVSQPSGVIEQAFTDLATDKYQRFVGCKINKVSMRAGGDGELVFSFGTVVKSDSLETSSFDATPTAVTLSRIENFSSALTVGGSTYSTATELNFDLNLNLTPYRFLGGGGTIGAATEAIADIRGSMTYIFDVDTIEGLANAGTESSLKWTAQAASNSIAEIEIQELTWEKASVPVSGPEGLMVTRNFVAHYTNGSEASAVVVRITNTTSSYSAVLPA